MRFEVDGAVGCHDGDEAVLLKLVRHWMGKVMVVEWEGNKRLTDELLAVSIAVKGFDAFLGEFVPFVVPVLAVWGEGFGDVVVESWSGGFVAHDG